jgi:anti-sigma B factor antagonist
MDVAERQLGDVVVLDLNGRLTLGDNSLRLKDKINSVLQDGRHNILLNLGDVSYIDSGGLGQLISSFKGVKTENGQLKLFNLGKKSKELLAMTKLVTIFDTFETEHEALASFQDGPA